MKGRPSVWRVTGGAVLGVMLALAPLPVAAAEPSPRAASVDFRAAVLKIAASETLASVPAAAVPARAQSGAASAPESRSFFKTPLGAAVIAVVGAGTAYAVYSAQHDRIHSASR